MKLPQGYLLLVAFLTTVGAITASAQTEAPSHVVTPTSSIAKAADAGVRFHTNLKIMGDGPMTGATQYSGPPFGGYAFETPASLACIYQLVPYSPASYGCNPNTVTAVPNVGSRAIVIVDAYDDPNAYADLQAFSSQFGLLPITPSSFHVVYAPSGGVVPGSCSGSPTEPPSSVGTGGWDMEESMDIEYAHAMAPNATLYLVEAQSHYVSDLLCAVAYGSLIAHSYGGGEVSMSWGSNEFPQETSMDGVFTYNNVVYFASAGDKPGPSWPGDSPNVVSVGGTTLSTNQYTPIFEGENTWQDSGGGVSLYEPRPLFQNKGGPFEHRNRSTPDVAIDGNPNTGVWVLNSLVYGPGSWYPVGGTSLSAPLMAGIVNAANHFASSTAVELNMIYQNPSGFSDITYGNCGLYGGTFALKNWDYCTGWGSPIGYSGK